jgi:uncharacterized membrane protein required for colicin V production
MKDLKLIFGSIHMKPLDLILALIALTSGVLGFVYLLVGFIKKPSGAAGIVLATCILILILNKYTKEWFKKRRK